jgi:hypothetical protein
MRKTRPQIIKVFIAILLIILGILIIMLPYIYNDYRFLLGGDSGAYVAELNKYIQSEAVKLPISFWNEPQLFIMLKGVNLFTNLESRELYLFFQAISIALLVFLLINIGKINLSDKNIYLGLVFIISSNILSELFFQAFYRQILGTIFFLTILYYLGKFEKDEENNKLAILVIIFSVALLITHRAISLIYFILLMIITIKYFVIKDRNRGIKIIKIAIMSLLLSSPYYILDLSTNFKVLEDTLTNSYNGIFTYSQHYSGKSFIQETQNLNPFVSYFFSEILIVSITLLSMLVLLYYDPKKAKSFLITVIILLLWTSLSFVFSNRLIVILHIFLCLLFVNTILKGWNLRTYKVLLFLIVVLLTITAVNYVKNKSPYIDNDTPGLDYIENNILINDSFIIAPRPIQVILGQLGYMTPMTYEKIGKNNKEWMDLTDEFFIYGPTNSTIIKEYIPLNKEVYIIIWDWYTKKPINDETYEVIDPLEWDNYDSLENKYVSDSGFIRIYKYNNSS